MLKNPLQIIEQDGLVLYHEKVISDEQIKPLYDELLNEIKTAFEKAGRAERQERALRMKIETKDVNASVLNRSKDWSQVRPEWGLTGCNAFVIAPRNRTKGMNLKGKSFLHLFRLVFLKPLSCRPMM